MFVLFLFYVFLSINAKDVYYEYNYKNLTLKFPQFSLENINGFSSIIISKNDNNYKFYLNENSVVSRMINKNLEFFYQLAIDVKRMENIIEEDKKLNMEFDIPQTPLPAPLSVPVSVPQQYISINHQPKQQVNVVNSNLLPKTVPENYSNDYKLISRQLV